MIGLLAFLGGGRRTPGLAPIVHTRTTNGSTTVTVPTYYRWADVYAIGAGGDGADGNVADSGGGGGGGGYAKCVSIPVTAGDEFTLLVASSPFEYARVTEVSTGALVEGRGGGNGTRPSGGTGGGFAATGTFSGGSTTTRTGQAGAAGVYFPAPTNLATGGNGGVSGAVLEGDNTLIASVAGFGAPALNTNGGDATGAGCGGGGGAATTGNGGNGSGNAAIVVFRTN